MNKKLKIALVHDDLVQWGGAERVLLAICESFPEAAIYTSVIDWANPQIKHHFWAKNIQTSFLQTGFKHWMYKIFLPLYPLAFEQFDFSAYDLVISQTTRFAKAIITKPATIHLCYSHTPPRFLWNYSGVKLGNWWQPYLNWLRIFDQVSSRRVDYWLAGSKNCQQRLKNVYQVESQVLEPFVDQAFLEAKLRPAGDYYVCIARLTKYKRVDLVVKACQQLKRQLVVVGAGPELERLQQLAGARVSFRSNMNEAELIELISRSKGAIIAAEEDFGLVSLEVQALGRGVVAFGRGGSAETVIEGKTGVLFLEQSVDSMVEAIKRFEKLVINPANCRTNAAKFSKQRFMAELMRLVEKL